MTQHSHQTAPTEFVEAKGIGFAYRRFGKTAGVLLDFNWHFTGSGAIANAIERVTP